MRASFLESIPRKPWLVAVLALFFLGLTNRWLVNDPDMSIYRFDSVSYLEIARHSPVLPERVDVSVGHPEMPEARETRIPYQHAQRFAFPYTVGIAAKALGIEPEWIFATLAPLLLLIISVLVGISLQRLGCTPALSSTLLLLLLLNPFVTRFYLSVPTYLGDLAFHLGMALLCWSLVAASPALLLTAVLVGTLGRQTMLTVLPGLLLWPWPGRAGLPRVFALKTVACLLAGGAYLLTGKAATVMNPFSRNLEHLLGLWGWLTANGMPGHSREGLSLSASAMVLLRFLGRAILATLPAFALLGALLAQRRYRQLALADRRLPALLLMAAGIMAQPILAGPTLTGDTIVRLVALAAVPLTLLIGLLIANQREQAEAQPATLVLACLTMLLASLHHRYSFTAGFSWSPALFLISQVLAAITITHALGRPSHLRNT